MPDDLFANSPKNISKPSAKKEDSYSAEHIEVLEGLEPVRRRPGMYIGGTDESAMHHLVAEVFDNAMDEAVAGHASRIELELAADGTVTVRDNGRGIPIDKHPKYKDKSALEVIMTVLHSGGKFSGKVYDTSGGLHGVGLSVVNALSEYVRVEVARDKTLWAQEFSRGEVTQKLKNEGAVQNRRGTSVIFRADTEIFGQKAKMRPARLYQFAKSKAYLFKGVEIRWSCDPAMVVGTDVPDKETIHFPNGLVDYLNATLKESELIIPQPFTGDMQLAENMGRVEWAIDWTASEEGFMKSFCNTVPTPQGGTHENGFRTALYKGLREFGDLAGNKKAGQITAEDVFTQGCAILSLFYRDPEFQGQTKDKLTSSKATRLVENAVRDHFDHWLSGNPDMANALLEFTIAHAEDRLRRRNLKDVSRKTVVHKLRLPGKLADCTQEMQKGTEIFLVEGDSAGGSAKQARDRKTQAILPLRGKILNVASATSDKIMANQEIKDMITAFGCGTGKDYNDEQLRYEKVIIMTDADVDGAHIASLLMTFFYQEMPGLIRNGHLYLAQPPLFRVKQGTKNYYAADDKDLARLKKELEKGRGNIEVGRFKGLGEMTPAQLKETTMEKSSRILLKVEIAEERVEETKQQVSDLMGKNPEPRFRFIQEQSAARAEEIAAALDV